MRLDVATVLHATGAQALRVGADGRVAAGGLGPADLEQVFAGVSIDSRSLPAAALFVALAGERVDGHDYVADALSAGALGCVVSRIPSTERLALAVQSGEAFGPSSRYLFVVPDSLGALQHLATFWRRRHHAEVIGITGSIGKTTTKELLASVLSAWDPGSAGVLKSEGNFNTEIGLPLTLLRLTPEHRVAVLEMGMYAAGDIALLARIARPRIGIVTNVAPIHLERLGSIERIARAKSELVAALPPDGCAILNADDPWTRAMAQASGIAPVQLVGQSEDADYRVTDIAVHGLEGTSFTLAAEGHRVALRTQVPGMHTVSAFAWSVAAARTVGMEWDAIRAAVERVRLEARQRILRLDDAQGVTQARGEPAGSVLIDDSYNASPLSVNAALELLAASPGAKIAVLGDMLELGPLEEEAHRSVGRRAATVADWLVVRGPRSAWIAEEAERQGLAADRVLRADSNAEAARAVRSIMLQSTNAPTMQGKEVERRAAGSAARWTVLVKGSRGMRMEEVVDALRGVS